jgi:hypothetical protein
VRAEAASLVLQRVAGGGSVDWVAASAERVRELARGWQGGGEAPGGGGIT